MNDAQESVGIVLIGVVDGSAIVAVVYGWLTVFAAVAV